MFEIQKLFLPGEVVCALVKVGSEGEEAEGRGERVDMLLKIDSKAQIKQ